MATSKHEGDLRVNGELSATTFILPASSVSNTSVQAATNIDADKLEMMHRIVADFAIDALAAPSTSTTFTQVVHRAAGAGTIRGVNFLLLDTGSQANTNDFTFELKKATAGAETLTTVLSAPIVIDSDSTDNTASSGSVSSAALVAGDLIAVEVITPSTITGAQGMIAIVDIDENPV